MIGSVHLVIWGSQSVFARDGPRAEITNLISLVLASAWKEVQSLMERPLLYLVSRVILLCNMRNNITLHTL